MRLPKVGFAIVLLGCFGAAADSLRINFPCSQAMTKAATAEVSRLLGAPVSSDCNCYDARCSEGRLTQEVAIGGASKLTLVLQVSRSVRDARVDPIPPTLTAASMTAFARRLSAHALIAALGPARCELSGDPSQTLRARCSSDHFRVELSEIPGRSGKKVTRTMIRSDLRLPIEALANDDGVVLARADRQVAEFLVGKTGVIAQYDGRILTLNSGAALGPVDAKLRGGDAVSIFFEDDKIVDVIKTCEGGKSCP